MARTTKEPIPAVLRWEIWERDDFTCHYCGARRHLSIDHRIPESHGGTLEPSNLVTACAQCNSRKRTKRYEVFKVESDPSLVGNDRIRFRDCRRWRRNRVVECLVGELDSVDSVAYMAAIYTSSARRAYHWKTESHHRCLMAKHGNWYGTSVLTFRTIRHAADGCMLNRIAGAFEAEYNGTMQDVLGIGFDASALLDRVRNQPARDLDRSRQLILELAEQWLEPYG